MEMVINPDGRLVRDDRDSGKESHREPGNEPGSKQDNGTHKGVAGSTTQPPPDFVPAYYDSETETVYLSRYSNGKQAPVHVLDTIPEELLQQNREHEAAHQSEPSPRLIVGFVHNNRFYTRAQAIEEINRQARKTG